jgi:hypothetical protein
MAVFVTVLQESAAITIKITMGLFYITLLAIALEPHPTL